MKTFETSQAENGQNAEIEKEIQVKANTLADVIESCLNTSMGGNYTERGWQEEGFSGDGASLFALIKFAIENGDKEKLKLIKIAWGEFSKQTFVGDKYPQFKDLPFALYCVDQRHSYLADDDVAAEYKNEPKKYLQNNAIIIVDEDGVTLKRRGNEEPVDHAIKSCDYNEALSGMRNLAINKWSSPESFSEFLQALPDDPSSVWEYIQAHKNDNNVRVLYSCGINRIGSGIGSVEAMTSLVAIKKQFNFDEQKF